MGDREDKKPGGGGEGKPKQIEPPGSNPARAPQNQGGQSSGSQAPAQAPPKSSIADFFQSKTSKRGGSATQRPAPTAWPKPVAPAGPSARNQPAAAAAAPARKPPPIAARKVGALSAWKKPLIRRAEPSTSAGPGAGEGEGAGAGRDLETGEGEGAGAGRDLETGEGEGEGAGAGRDLETDFGSLSLENPEPEEDRSEAGSRPQSPVANFAIVNLPQQQAGQGAAGGQHRRGQQEENQQWASLIKRGGMYMEDVSREELENWAVYGPGYFDAIFPILPVDPYPKYINLLTNHFEIVNFVDQSWNYKGEWDPSHIGNNYGLSEWRMKAFEALNEVAYETWTAQGLEAERECALGCWDRGPELLRVTKLDPEASLSFGGVGGYLPFKDSSHSTRHFDFRMRYIHHQPQNSQGPLDPISVRWTDYENFMTTGGAWSQITNLFNALQIVLAAYPTRNHNDFLEDWTRKRHFFHSGYPNLNDPKAAYVKSLNFNYAVDRFCFLRRGFRMTTKILQKGIFVNMHTCINMFWGRNSNLFDVMQAVAELHRFEVGNGIRVPKHSLRTLESTLKYLRVKSSLSNLAPQLLAEYPVKYYKIYGFSNEPASELLIPKYEFHGRITKEAGYKLNFFDFLQEFYGVNQFNSKRVAAKYALLPAVKVHPRFHWYLPPWVLTAKDGDKFPSSGKTKLSTMIHGRLQDIHRQELVRERFKSVKQQLRERLAADPWLKMFDLVIDQNFLRVKGYKMPPPDLFLANAATNELERAGDARENGWFQQPNQRFVAPADKLDDFIVYTVGPVTPIVAGNLMRAIQRTLRIRNIAVNGTFDQLGNNITDLGFVDNIDQFSARLRHELETYVTCRGSKPRLVYCVVNEKSRFYFAFKYILDHVFGIHSQWIIAKSIADSPQDMTFGVTETGKRKLNNLVLKLNRKLGGMNVYLRTKWLSDVPGMLLPGTMIFGADVTHPTAEMPHSIASVTASNDMPPRTFGARCRIQEAREEMIYELADMVCDLVRAFRKKNPHTVLENLIFFRDGVCNEAYRQVLREEVPRIYDGIQRGGGGNRVKLLLVVCLKRHHTRFMNAITNKCIDHGTAINDLNQPHQQNFYMSSHQAQLSHSQIGISRPVCYQVIVDQIGLTLNELQTLVYHSSFTYEKNYRSLFTSPSSHYSHMACTRAKCYYQELKNSRNAPEFPPLQRTPGSRPYHYNVRSDLTPHENIRDTMFYL